MNKTLNVDEVLGLSRNKTPSFEQKTKPSGFFLDKNDPNFRKPDKKPTGSAEILKPAQINKEVFDSLKEFEKNYQKFKDLNELVLISKDQQAENKEKAEKKEKKIELGEKNEVMPQNTRVIKPETNQEKKNKDFSKKSKKIGKKPRSSIKDKEKEKRMKGQSSISNWKSETFMNLRQQFD
jgi:hypothetical protein